jgi:hypothetical protein
MALYGEEMGRCYRFLVVLRADKQGPTRWRFLFRCQSSRRYCRRSGVFLDFSDILRLAAQGLAVQHLHIDQILGRSYVRMLQEVLAVGSGGPEMGDSLPDRRHRFELRRHPLARQPLVDVRHLRRQNLILLVELGAEREHPLLQLGRFQVSEELSVQLASLRHLKMRVSAGERAPEVSDSTHIRYTLEDGDAVRHRRHLFHSDLEGTRRVRVEPYLEHLQHQGHGQGRRGVLVAYVLHPLDEVGRYL